LIIIGFKEARKRAGSQRSGAQEERAGMCDWYK
jgi:hypothetical protein